MLPEEDVDIIGNDDSCTDNDESEDFSDDDDVEFSHNPNHAHHNHNRGRDSKPQAKKGKSSARKAALLAMLEKDMSDFRGTDALQAMEEEEDLDAEAKQIIEGMCVECGDQPATLSCNQCEDNFCLVCFQALHRKGNRTKHTTKPLEKTIVVDAAKPQATEATTPAATTETATDSANGSASTSTTSPQPQQQSAAEEGSDDSEDEGNDNDEQASKTKAELSFMIERCKYIPLRLTLEERKLLRLLEATMHVSEYTDKIDIYSHRSKAARIHAQIKEICAILSGLLVATDYKKGQELVRENDFKENAEFFQNIFEIGRRYKILNPEKMRNEYGKLMYMLQDSVSPEVQNLLEFSCVKKVRMVYDFLAERDGLDMLADEDILIATAEIVADRFPSRYAVQSAIRQKERCVERLVRKYQNRNLSDEDIKRCLYSISDNNAFLRANRDPCLRMIQYLTTNFKEDTFEQGSSLAIVGGRHGARLTHSHTTQYNYVLQSLTLWSEIANHMYKLWYLTEEDLLDESSRYHLCDTGQGLQRVQRCSRVSKAMHSILYSAQRKLGGWVGSSVIHLGDHAVPNALMFIDKYTQVARILNPVVITLSQIDVIARDPKICDYIESAFGSVEGLRKEILCDFFRYAFDGSGADNFYDAGSCIDGRLTSAWNWCSKIEKKPYFPIFLLTGFIGFDGEF